MSQQIIDTLVDALRKIYGGAAPVGRWCKWDHPCQYRDVIDQGDAVPCEAVPPDGYYAVDESGTYHGPGAEPDDKEPAVWWPYTNEETAEWCETCADIAEEALAAVGVTVPQRHAPA